MSKGFGLPRARIGWLATRDHELLERFAAFKDYTTICSSAPAEILALIALRAKEQSLNEQLSRIKRNLNLLEAFFVRHQATFSRNRPKAGTVAFPRLKFGSVSEFCQSKMSEADIMLLPSTVYDYGDSHFRVGFGRENLPQVLANFEKYVTKS